MRVYAERITQTQYNYLLPAIRHRLGSRYINRQRTDYYCYGDYDTHQDIKARLKGIH